jgi:hypothetical protein
LDQMTGNSYYYNIQHMYSLIRLYMTLWLFNIYDEVDFKGTVQRDRFGWKWYQSIDLSLNVRR